MRLWANADVAVWAIFLVRDSRERYPLYGNCRLKIFNSHGYLEYLENYQNDP